MKPTPAPITASAPASMMLMGEHAVLHGYPCLVAALDKRLYVTLTPREDKQITIHSEAFGDYQTDTRHLKLVEPFGFVLGALRRYQQQLKTGCEINITAEFSATVGFGSSAAVTVATVAAVRQWLGLDMAANTIVTEAIYVLHLVQGRGSGADIAASVFGGVLKYTSAAAKVEPLPAKIVKALTITLVYCGYKTPTANVIKTITKRTKKDPARYKSLYDAIGDSVDWGVNALNGVDPLTHFAKAVQRNQELMTELGVNDETLQKIIDALLQNKGILAAKISGSGLGDCVFGLGKPTKAIDWQSIGPDVAILDAAIDTQGVRLENNPNPSPA